MTSAAMTASDFLVMEYLEGETLAQVLARGKLHLDRALTYADQIADALAARTTLPSCIAT